MASRTKIKTWITQNINTQQPTATPPVTTPAVTVSSSELICDTPSAPGPM